MSTQSIRKSTLRWRGIALFLLFIGLLMAFSLLFLDGILRWTLTRSLGTLNGAEVNIGQVQHQWSPLRLEMADLQFTDPAQPQQNRLQISSLSGSINVEQLILGRLHIEQLVARGIRLNQPRTQAGQVYQPPSQEALRAWASGTLQDLNLQLPSVDQVLQGLQLQTPVALAQAEEDLQAIRARIEQAKAQLPSKQQLADYQAQIKQLTEGGMDLSQLAAKQQQFEQLRTQFARDRALLAELQQLAKQLQRDVQRHIEALRQAPAADLARVQQLLQLNSESLTEITALLFGEQIREWSAYALLAYQQLAPMLQRAEQAADIEPPRGTGVWFSFADVHNAPEFLIKEASTEFALGSQVIEVAWQNITHQHPQLGQPTTYQASLKDSSQWGSFSLNGELSLLAEGVDARQQWQLRAAPLHDLVLSEQASLRVQVLAALVDSEGSVQVRSGALSGDVTVRFAEMQVDAAAENRWTQVIASALTQLQRLDLQAALGGSLRVPELRLRSDLDQQLGAALQRAALDVGRTELAQLQQDLEQQTAGVLANANTDLASLTSLLGDAAARDQALQELLQRKLQPSLEEQLKDRLRGRVGGG